MHNDESYVSTLVRVKVEGNGNITQDLKMDTMNGLVKYKSTYIILSGFG